MRNTKTLSGMIEARFGWDAYPRQYSGGMISGLLQSKSTNIDCDAGALLCGIDGKPLSTDVEKCFINYNVTSMYDSAIMHCGDNQTGSQDDDEIILSALT